MKFLILIFFSLSVHATVYEYKEVIRTFKNLEQIDFSACELSYRFINNNWMDCRLQLPALINSPIAQISPLRLEKHELMTSQPDGLNYFTRLETSYHDMDEASAVTPFIASSYYQIPGESRIHSSTSDSYSKPIFTQHLWAVLKEWKPQGSTIIAYDPTKTSPFFNDEVKGSVFFGEKSESPDATKCLNNYEHDQEDNWPDDEEIWFSQCSYFEEKNFLYLALQSFWSARLKASALEETKLIHLSQGKIAQVTYSATGFSIQLGNDQAAGPDFNLDLKPEEARPLIVEAVKKAGTMKARFFILEKNKDGLKGSEKITGKLVMKRTRMRDEIDLIDIQ